ARQDSNLGPTDYEPAALTAELRARLRFAAAAPSNAARRRRTSAGASPTLFPYRLFPIAFPSVPACSRLLRRRRGGLRRGRASLEALALGPPLEERPEFTRPGGM